MEDRKLSHVTLPPVFTPPPTLPPFTSLALKGGNLHLLQQHGEGDLHTLHFLSLFFPPAVALLF